MVIAAGSYPAGRWFESDRRYQIRPLGQEVKTSPFHGGNASSILAGVTILWGVSSAGRASALQAGGHRFEPCTPHHNISTVNTVLFFLPKMQSPLITVAFLFNGGQQVTLHFVLADPSLRSLRAPVLPTTIVAFFWLSPAGDAIFSMQNTNFFSGL